MVAPNPPNLPNGRSMLKMLFTCLLITSASLVPGALKAQTVYSVQYKSDADVKVYVAQYKSDADLVVYKAKYKSDAGDNNGVWFFTDYKSDAKKTVFFCDYKSDADLVIYFSEYKSDAGWKNSSKKQLMY
jgi:hypothetical protein